MYPNQEQKQQEVYINQTLPATNAYYTNSVLGPSNRVAVPVFIQQPWRQNTHWQNKWPIWPSVVIAILQLLLTNSILACEIGIVVAAGVTSIFNDRDGITYTFAGFWCSCFFICSWISLFGHVYLSEALLQTPDTTKLKDELLEEYRTRYAYNTTELKKID
ncbi:unnamed protein product [Didymodactylos carnosus]|uniref:Uncharacterized protein n=1 Tax=Didymodactylos carnosus TaxID=1234261 RepID=A0A814YR37_9BILA|nr:unnamed protein product [Didymodactylos carnosus]CAF3995784.1 unnamed protein product [Didymodactylos carnosus]